MSCMHACTCARLARSLSPLPPVRDPQPSRQGAGAKGKAGARLRSVSPPGRSGMRSSSPARGTRMQSPVCETVNPNKTQSKKNTFAWAPPSATPTPCNNKFCIYSAHSAKDCGGFCCIKCKHCYEESVLTNRLPDDDDAHGGDCQYHEFPKEFHM